MKKIVIISFISIAALLLSKTRLTAQDFQLSQYYAAPLYLNPAFTGSGKMHRFNLNYRLQWPGLRYTNAYRTMAFSYDYNLSELNSGFGLLATRDVAGSGDLGNTSAGFLYAFRAQINKKLVFAAGSHFSYNFTGLNANGLTLGDQLASDRPVSFDSELQQVNRIQYFDFATGILVYGKSLWGGVSLHHLTQPDVSLIGDSNPLQMRFSVHGGVRIPLYRGPKEFDHISSIAPSFIYKRQGNNDQLDVGIDWHYDPISAGFWYRGFPFAKNQENNFDRDAMIFHFGLEIPQLKAQIGYSYDFTISEFGGISGGAHEVSISMDIVGTFRKKRKEEFLPCPTFN
ncbi:PorP/SprF family type IX secretion system membrane protein [Marivirga atlantica]|uniref:PorP/SprF family type IX secretion system membrane protein n=1 Tax=Marivirga atlantica TaxID=1548457 RepID=A0A937DJ65_9BACT|nr:PorP/SprF family type IX secretion system membrane protein [Marivirga atlantica]MBL0765680.1 PorP/SprF family type IX secretion system membrane protein [Marivirga atlantica]